MYEISQQKCTTKNKRFIHEDTNTRNTERVASRFTKIDAKTSMNFHNKNVQQQISTT